MHEECTGGFRRRGGVLLFGAPNYYDEPRGYYRWPSGQKLVKLGPRQSGKFGRSTSVHHIENKTEQKRAVFSVCAGICACRQKIHGLMRAGRGTFIHKMVAKTGPG
jgi:hypothetical protein